MEGLRRIYERQSGRTPGVEHAFEIFRRAAIGTEQSRSALTASAAGLTDGDRRLAAKVQSECGERLIIDEGGAWEQARIGCEIFLGPHIQQERRTRGSDYAGGFVGRNGIGRRYVSSSVAGIDVERDL